MRQVVRRLVRLPVFTLVAVATLSIGIGANTSIFSVVEGVLLKPLAYPHPDALVDVDYSAAGVGIKSAGASPFLYFTNRDQGRTLADIGMWRGDTVSITGRAEPEEIDCVEVTDGVLRVFGVQPYLGRTFTANDDMPGSPRTVVLMNGYWRTKFGGDTSIVGRQLMVDGLPREIIGVMPEKFHFLNRKPALLLPMRLDSNDVHLGNFSYQAIGRLRPGVTLAQATADADRLIPVSIHRYPPFPGYSTKMFEDARLAANLRPLKDSMVGDIGSVLWVLMGTIGIVLLIACANVANLLLVRAEGRQQELAIRAALGAGWGQIAKELLAESVTLGIAGGMVGLGIAYIAVRALVSIAPISLPRLDEISVDGVVLAFTFAISILAGLLFGSIPVFKYVGPQLANALRGGGRTASDSRQRHRARSALVVAQVALALVLLVASGLMIRTFQGLRRVKPGFTSPETIQTFRISIPESQVKDDEQAVRMVDAIADKIGSIPGVLGVAASNIVPMSGTAWQDPVFTEDQPVSEAKIPPLRSYRMVTPGLFSTLGNRIVAGRDFTWSDVYDKRPVAIVSENMARELWKDASEAIGKRIRESLKGTWREIVGVAGDERDDGVDRPAPTTAYWPILMANFEGSQTFAQRSLSYFIRSPRTGSSGFMDEVGRAVWSVNPSLPLASVRTLREVFDRSLARTSFTLVMLAIAGAMALLLGVAGVYGVIAYSVSQRTREVGIRVALGAKKPEVIGMFVGHGLRLAAIGIGFGIVAALVTTRLLSSFLFGVRTVDPLTYAAVSLGLAGAAALASYVPALQATSVDPVDALRAE